MCGLGLATSIKGVKLPGLRSVQSIAVSGLRVTGINVGGISDW